MKWLMGVVAGAMCVLGASTASAQVLRDWTEKGFLNINGAAQVVGQDINNTILYDLYLETATIEASRDVPGGLFFDMMEGARLMRNLGAGLNYNGRSKKDDANYTASIPDPVNFDAFRIVAGTIPDMKFSEYTFAPLVVGRYPVTDVIDAIGFIGPAIRHVNADVVTGATIAETADPAAPHVTPTVERIGKTFVGVQIGIDLRYTLNPRFGVGGFIRYTGGGGDLSEGVKIDAPGIQLGAGLRIKF